MPKDVNQCRNRANRLGARFPNLGKMGDAVDGLRDDGETTLASASDAKPPHLEKVQATGGTRFYNKAKQKQKGEFFGKPFFILSANLTTHSSLEL